MGKKIGIKYVMRKLTISKKTIDNFYMDVKERRRIRWTNVENLKRKLKAREHFSAPFVLNRKNGKNKVLDGNHRFEAIKDIMDKNPNFSIDVWCACYDNLSATEEREVFTLWNIGTKQTHEDFLKIHIEHLPIAKKAIDEIPCSIYTSPSKPKFKTIVGAYLQMQTGAKRVSAYRSNVKKFICDIQENLDSDVIKHCRAFMLDLEQVFGKYDKSNPFYTTGPITVLFRIWHDNLSKNRPHMLNAFRKVLLGNGAFRWQELAKATTNNYSINYFYKDLIRELNKGRVKFKTIEETQEVS